MKGEKTAGAISTPQMYFTFWLTENKQFEFDLIVQKGTSDYYWAIRLLLNKNSETVCQIFLFFPHELLVLTSVWNGVVHFLEIC